MSLYVEARLGGLSIGGDLFALAELFALVTPEPNSAMACELYIICD